MIIHYNPAARASPPKPEKPEPDYFQPEVLDDILAALENIPLKRKAIAYLPIDMGFRRGEAVGLIKITDDSTSDKNRNIFLSGHNYYLTGG